MAMDGGEDRDVARAAGRPRPSSPALPCTVHLQVAAMSFLVDAINRRDGTVNRGLYSVVDRLLSVRASPRPDASSVRSADFAVDASRGLWARVFSPAVAPPPSSPLPVIVYFHGGGFELFSPANRPFDALCRRFCSRIGAVVVSVNYRLSPEHRHPAAYDDGMDALRFLGANGVPGLDDNVEADLSSCFLVGESAGGNIAHHLANRWAATSQPSSSRSLRLAGVVMVQPYFGGEERTDSELRLDGVAPLVNIRRSDFWWKAFLPVGASRDHPAAHVTNENVELAEGYPPAMVVVGGFDPLQDWQRRFADVLRHKGRTVRVVEFPEEIHAFYIFPELAGSAKAIEDMRLFVEMHRSSRVSSDVGLP